MVRNTQVVTMENRKRERRKRRSFTDDFKAEVVGLVRDHDDGLLVDDPTDSDALAEAILRQLISPMEAEAMGRSGHNRVRGHFLLLTQAPPLAHRAAAAPCPT